MALTYSRIMAVAGLSRSQARRLIERPYPIPAHTIKRDTSGRRELEFSFANLAGRLVEFGLSTEIISRLAIASTEKTTITLEYNNE